MRECFGCVRSPHVYNDIFESLIGKEFLFFGLSHSIEPVEIRQHTVGTTLNNFLSKYFDLKFVS